MHNHQFVQLEMQRFKAKDQNNGETNSYNDLSAFPARLHLKILPMSPQAHKTPKGHLHKPLLRGLGMQRYQLTSHAEQTLDDKLSLFLTPINPPSNNLINLFHALPTRVHLKPFSMLPPTCSTLPTILRPLRSQLNMDQPLNAICIRHFPWCSRYLNSIIRRRCWMVRIISNER